MKKYIPSRYKAFTKRFFKNLGDSFVYAFKRNNTGLKYENFVFVCKGNVCRSTFAENYLKKILPQNNHISSCGLDVDQGGSSPEKAIQIAVEFGVDMSESVAKSINSLELESDTQIIAMEFNQYQRLIDNYPNHKKNIILLRDFLPWPSRFQCNIADPYGGEDSDFRSCFRTIKNALDNMALQISDGRSHY